MKLSAIWSFAISTRKQCLLPVACPHVLFNSNNRYLRGISQLQRTLSFQMLFSPVLVENKKSSDRLLLSISHIKSITIKFPTYTIISRNSNAFPKKSEQNNKNNSNYTQNQRSLLAIETNYYSPCSDVTQIVLVIAATINLDLVHEQLLGFRFTCQRQLRAKETRPMQAFFRSRFHLHTRPHRPFFTREPCDCIVRFTILHGA